MHIRKALVNSGKYLGQSYHTLEAEEEVSAEMLLKMQVYKPYSELLTQLSKIEGLIQFSTDNVEDAEFAATISKKIIKDLSAAVAAFDKATNG